MLYNRFISLLKIVGFHGGVLLEINNGSKIASEEMSYTGHFNVLSKVTCDFQL